MELKRIEKAIELLKSNNIKELQELLEFERQASILNGKGKDVKFATLVKNLLSSKYQFIWLQSCKNKSIGRAYIYD